MKCENYLQFIFALLLVSFFLIGYLYFYKLDSITANVLKIGTKEAKEGISVISTLNTLLLLWILMKIDD